MAALTMAQLFGTHSVLNTETGMLTIQLSDLSDVGLTKDQPTATQILTALILKLRAAIKMPDCINDRSVGMTITDPFKLFLTRGSENHTGYQFDLTIYTVDQVPSLNSDDVV